MPLQPGATLGSRYGLDRAAGNAPAEWRVEPGLRRCQPVINVEMTFALR